MIALLDYGAGNTGSVLRAVQYLGHQACIVDRAEQLATASKIIFPGQGHFATMMQALEEHRLMEPLRKVLEEAKPFLGICLGLQALYEGSDEAPGLPGLGILPGRVRRFEGVFKVPHVGWSQLEISQDGAPESGLLRGIPDRSFVYYCHSYYGPQTRESVAVTDYGQRFAAAVEMGESRRLWAVQFHPEKSGEVGLRVLKNFLEL
ncbi:MAG TPA: imidazole glycerol phosphate synthase subunit HisH [Terriglobia bacterium]|nr:imidazole glycerol phosphate synthase subunit HisH [Terriglobia bacterium]